MMELFTFCLLTSLAIQAIYICVHWDGMILNWLQPYAFMLPEWLGKPLCNCPVCMASAWGTLFYLLFVEMGPLTYCWVILIIAGMNAVLAQVIELLRLIIEKLND